MKSVIRGAMCVVAGVFAFAAAAQAGTLEVNVPFAFMVGAQKMPAGVYRIERDTQMPSSVVFIRGEHGNTAQLFVQTTPLKGANPAGDGSALVFVPDEGANRLTQVWGSSSAGQEVTGGHSKAKQVGQVIVVGRRLS